MPLDIGLWRLDDGIQRLLPRECCAACGARRSLPDNARLGWTHESPVVVEQTGDWMFRSTIGSAWQFGDRVGRPE